MSSKRHVLGDGEVGDDSVVQPVFGNVGDAEAPRFVGRQVNPRRAEELERSLLDDAQAREERRQLALPVAVDARNAHHFARPHLERDVLQLPRRDALERHHDSSRLRGRGRLWRRSFSHHQRSE